MEKAICMHPDARVVFFLGDGLRDIEYIMNEYPDKDYYRVSGNCDGLFTGLPVTSEVVIEGKRIMLTHGHEYGVKSGTERLERAAFSRGADIALFGHTHLPTERYIDGGGESASALYLFNPGSISYTYGTESFVIITLYRDKAPLFSHGKI